MVCMYNMSTGLGGSRSPAQQCTNGAQRGVSRKKEHYNSAEVERRTKAERRQPIR